MPTRSIEELNQQYSAAFQQANQLKNQVTNTALNLELDHAVFTELHARYVAAARERNRVGQLLSAAIKARQESEAARREELRQRRRTECDGKSKGELLDMLGIDSHTERVRMANLHTKAELIERYAAMVV